MSKLFMTGIIVACAVSVISLPFIALEAGRYFNPRYEDLRYETYTHSRTYVDGNIAELRRLQMQWNAASTEQQKQTIGTYARSVAQNIANRDNLPNDVLNFIRQVGG